MTKEKAASFLIGLGISGFISLIVYYILYTETIDLFGVESITNPEGRHSIIFYTTLILTAATLGITAISLLSGNKTLSIGLSLPLIIGIFILLKIGIVFFNKSNYYKAFDQKEWLIDNDKLKMARKLVKDDELIGLTKGQLIQMLGNGEERNYSGKEFYVYKLDQTSIKLELIFNASKVNCARIVVDGTSNLI